MKRGLDLFGAAFGLILFSPAMSAIALLLALERSGPVFYRQERVGLHGETFILLKFRTMKHGASGVEVTSANDDRITSVGRYLRQTKADELPQLLNVLKGEMSLVGPRPEVPKYVAWWPPEAKDVILSVRPGITDPASIVYRNESEFLATFAEPEIAYREVILPQKVELYLRYVQSRTVRDDVRILWKTMRALVSSQKAT